MSLSYFIIVLYTGLNGHLRSDPQCAECDTKIYI